MEQKTICLDSNVGQRLDKFNNTSASLLVYMGEGISLVNKVTVGRDEKNDISLEGKLISRI